MHSTRGLGGNLGVPTRTRCNLLARQRNAAGRRSNGPKNRIYAYCSLSSVVQELGRMLETNLSSMKTLGHRKPGTNLVNQRYRQFLDDWDKGFMEAKECSEGCWLNVVYGKIPKDLEGTLFRNGPGKFKVGNRQISHPYDGDGFVASISFKDGKAFFRSQFVKTAEYESEKAANDVLYRGTFATQRSGGAINNAGDLYVKNSSNTNVMAYGDKLWSLFEAGQPYSLDPETLDTVGLETFGGLIHAGLPFDVGSDQGNAVFSALAKLRHKNITGILPLPEELLNAQGDAVTAHPKLDPITGRLCLFSYRVRPEPKNSLSGSPPISTDITFWEFDEETLNQVQGDKAPRKVTHTLKGFAFLHDFAITENYYVIFQNPVTVNNLPYMLGQYPAASCVRWIPGVATVVHLIPRNISDQSRRVLTFQAPPLFVFHHANAYETQDQKGHIRVIIDSVQYDSLPAIGKEALESQGVDANAAFTSRLRRIDLDLDSHMMRISKSFDGYFEMPSIHPSKVGMPHRYVYGYHSIFEEPSLAIAKVDVGSGGNETEIWCPGPHRFCLEPKFVPRSQTKEVSPENEDDGWLLTQVFDAETLKTDIVILDAANICQGPVAVVSVRDPLPSALHGAWSETYRGPQKDPTHDAEASEEANVVPFSKTQENLRGRGILYQSKRKTSVASKP
jgi:all-trans-8'-apo-beta-carotenal 15,15'-oxygenase